MRISDWSSDVCSSDLAAKARGVQFGRRPTLTPGQVEHARELLGESRTATETAELLGVHRATLYRALRGQETSQAEARRRGAFVEDALTEADALAAADQAGTKARSEEHTSELQSLMRISSAVFCLN